MLDYFSEGQNEKISQNQGELSFQDEFYAVAFRKKIIKDRRNTGGCRQMD
jgi:hypothetical protein